MNILELGKKKKKKKKKKEEEKNWRIIPCIENGLKFMEMGL